MSDLKKLVADCFEVRPAIYWIDLLCTALVAWSSFAATEVLWDVSRPAAALCFLVSTFAFYRGVLFIHELTHRDRAELPGFSLAWNLLFGVPSLMPSFTYRGVHLEHHKKSSYGTRRDFEYLPFGASPVSTVAWLAAQSFVMPAKMFLRFGVLAPLSLLVPRLRRWVTRHASALTLRFELAREVPTGKDLRNWHVQELLCFLWVATVAALPLGVFIHLYVLMTAVFLLNAVRTPISHRYLNATERELSFTEQVLDSVNIDGGLLAELVCPLGFRYHGLHHLLPGLPYHQLGAAHRRLRAQLPRDSFYHSTVERSVGAALRILFRGTSRRFARA